MNVKPNHPLQELLAKLLFGIETVPPKEQRRMVNRACREAVKWHEKQMKLEGAMHGILRGEYEIICPDCDGVVCKKGDFFGREYICSNCGWTVTTK